MIVQREQLEAALAGLRIKIPDPRAGILGPHSTVWRIGGDLALFLGGGRAALLQLAHPMVAHAIDDHSHTRTDVVGRFQRTFRNVFAMVFGDLDDAFTAARRVHSVHARIHGVMPEAVGGWPAATPYHANDAHALRWVHATLVDTTLAVRALVDGPLPLDVRDRYVIEMNRFAALFGIPAELLPDGWRDHDRYMQGMLASDRIAVAPCAREMARFLVGRGTSAAQPALGRIAEAIAHELLPRHLAEQFELRGTPRRTRAGLAAFVSIYRQLPQAAVVIPGLTHAQHRLGGPPPSRYARWTERQLYGLARRATGTPPPPRASSARAG